MRPARAAWSVARDSPVRFPQFLERHGLELRHNFSQPGLAFAPRVRIFGIDALRIVGARACLNALGFHSGITMTAR